MHLVCGIYHDFGMWSIYCGTLEQTMIIALWYIRVVYYSIVLYNLLWYFEKIYILWYLMVFLMVDIFVDVPSSPPHPSFPFKVSKVFFICHHYIEYM